MSEIEDKQADRKSYERKAEHPPHMSSASDSYKRVKHLRVIPFSGKQDDWNLWKYKYETALNAFGFKRYLISKDGHNESDVVIICGVTGNLVACMPEAVYPLFMNLPHWTFQQADDQVVSAECTHPADIWKVLQQRYEKKTDVQCMKLWEELHSLKMKEDFRMYAAKIEDLVAKLAGFQMLISDKEKLMILHKGIAKSADHLTALMHRQEGLTYDAACDTYGQFFDRGERDDDDEQTILNVKVETRKQDVNTTQKEVKIRLLVTNARNVDVGTTMKASAGSSIRSCVQKRWQRKRCEIKSWWPKYEWQDQMLFLWRERARCKELCVHESSTKGSTCEDSSWQRWCNGYQQQKRQSWSGDCSAVAH